MRGLAAAACLLGNSTLAEPPQDPSVDCQILLRDLPEVFQTLELASCSNSTSTQIRAQAVFIIAAADVADWADLLSQDYGMGQFRLTCCGYEAHPPGILPIPAGSDMEQVTQTSTLPFLDVTLYAPGINLNGSINAPSDPLSIGDADGTLTITWGEV